VHYEAWLAQIALATEIEARNIILPLRRFLNQGVRQMVRSKPSKQLSQAEIEGFLVAAEALHLSIIKPFISPHCDHYRQTRLLHEVPLKSRAGCHRAGSRVHPVEHHRTG
jgi:hypothetical protein